MSEKQKPVAPDASAAGSSGSSFFSVVVRYGIVLALAYFLLKPYLFQPKYDPLGVQNFRVFGETMGTSWHATIAASPTKLLEISQGKSGGAEALEYETCENFLSAIIQAELDKVDQAASTYIADSDVSRFSASESTDWFEVSADTAKIVDLALRISEKTGGAFDVTVAPLVNMYRFGPNKTPLTELPSAEEIAAVRQKIGFRKLHARLDPPALKKDDPALTVDLSGIAKGFAVDLAGEALEALGLDDYMVEVGGEMRIKGQKIAAPEMEHQRSDHKAPWTLGVQTPEALAGGGSPDLYATLSFGENTAGAALATSGNYAQYLQVGDVRFSHIVDPRTGRPTEIIDGTSAPKEQLGSVTVVSKDVSGFSCAETDAYATAFFVLGAQEGKELADDLGIAALWLTRNDESARVVGETPSKAFGEINFERVGDAEEAAE